MSCKQNMRGFRLYAVSSISVSVSKRWQTANEITPHFVISSSTPCVCFCTYSCRHSCNRPPGTHMANFVEKNRWTPFWMKKTSRIFLSFSKKVLSKLPWKIFGLPKWLNFKNYFIFWTTKFRFLFKLTTLSMENNLINSSYVCATTYQHVLLSKLTYDPNYLILNCVKNIVRQNWLNRVMETDISKQTMCYPSFFLRY
jgi:hypothetical protein